MSRKVRFTIYDALEAAGFFDNNPANTFARDKDGMNLYKGPVEYPKMLYHPRGEEVITVPAEIVATPLGAKLVGEQKKLISKIVENAEQDEAAQAEGWHDHPAKAIRARIQLKIKAGELTEDALKNLPVAGTTTQIKDLEAEIAKLQAALGKQQEQEKGKNQAQTGTGPKSFSNVAPLPAQPVA